MQRKIGEIFEHNGEWYQCVNGGCKDCDFSKDTFYCKYLIGRDFCKSNSIFKKLEKVGEPFSEYNPSSNRVILFQRYKCYQKPVFNDNITGTWRYWFESNTIEIEIKQNKEDMEQEIEYFGDENTKHSNPESVGKNLKEFDLKAAKQGKPVCTRDGRKARIICFDAKFPKTGNIVTLVEKENGEEVTLYHYDDGHCSIGRDYDLMMLPEKKEGWVNLYKSSVRSTKEEAMKYRNKCNDYIDTIKISWEE